MRISDAVLGRRIDALEHEKRASERVKARVRAVDILPNIAGCYHALYEDIRAGKHTFINLPGGRGSGKSSFVALAIVDQIMKDQTGQSNALVVRKWAVALRGSVYSQIQWAIDTLHVSGLWRSTLTPMTYTFKPTGQVISFTGLDDPQKLKSLKPNKGYFRFLWLEEFNEISGEPELRNLQQSVMRGGELFTVFRSFNPPISSAAWANVFIKRPDDRAVTLLTDYRMIPEKWLGQTFIDEAERLKEINPRAYDHEYLGIPVGNGAEVFPNLEIRKVSDEEIQNAQYIYQGLDFGFAADPTAFVRLSYDQKTDTILFIDEFYKRHMSNRQIADAIRAKGYDHDEGKPGYSPIWMTDIPAEQFSRVPVICDCAAPKDIADLVDMGIKAKKCHKFPNCVEYRVKWLQHRRIVIDPARTPESAREFQNYSYMVDRKSGEILSALPDADNHTIDACAYALDLLIYRKGISA